MPAPSPGTEQRIMLHAVDWRTYMILDDAIDTPGVRMALEVGLPLFVYGPGLEPDECYCVVTGAPLAI